MSGNTDSPTATPSSTRSASPSVAESDITDEDRQKQEDMLLSDVNYVLHNIVSPSVSFEEENGFQRDDNGEKRESVTLTGSELTSLRKLETRIRSVIEKRQRNFRRSVTGNENLRIRDHARDKLKKTRHSVQQTARKVVTGDSTKHIKDWAREAKVVKTVDKFSFMLGIFSLLSTEYVLLKYPQHFGLFYVAVMSYMIILRVYMYANAGHIYFMIDFCYFANASCFVSVLFLKDNQTLWRINYAVSNGLLLAAILAWRNSLVFHSLDKITSFAIHIMPSLLTFLERWPSDGQSVMCPKDENVECNLGVHGAFTYPVIFYIVWQLYYILQTEVIDRKRLKGDPGLATSLRWIARNTKNPMNKIALSVCRATGILRRDEKFEPEALKTKAVFWISQLIFMMATLIPIPFMFSFCNFHWVYIMYVFGIAVWNGSNYYFEVFAARYIQQFENQNSGVAVSVPPTKEQTPGSKTISEQIKEE